jgi:hypothetical protein
MPTTGKLEITIKINEFPKPIRTVRMVGKSLTSTAMVALSQLM